MLTVFKALADPTRLRILNVLLDGEFTVQELTHILNMGQSRISRHLKILCDAGFLFVQQQGTWRYYSHRPDNDFVASLWALMAPRTAETDPEGQDRLGVETVMAERRRRSREFFNRVADDWDNLAAARLSLPDYLDALLSMVNSVSTAVEVGIGSGQLLKRLAEKAPHVIGIDHSPEMLRKSRMQLNGCDHVDLRLGEMTHLPLADPAVDAVILNQVLHHAEHPQAVIEEMARVLAPGGSLVIADLAHHQQDWVRDELADQWLGFTRGDLEGWLDRAAFRTETYRTFSTEEGFDVFLLTANTAIKTPSKGDDQ